MPRDRTFGRKARFSDMLFVIYLFLQITVPLVGLYAAHTTGEPARLSWHMFSRIPPDVDE